MLERSEALPDLFSHALSGCDTVLKSQAMGKRLYLTGFVQGVLMNT